MNVSYLRAADEETALSRSTVLNDTLCIFCCRALQFVYPYGATLNIAKPSTAVLSTGSACIPVNRPVLAFYKSKV